MGFSGYDRKYHFEYFSAQSHLEASGGWFANIQLVSCGGSMHQVASLFHFNIFYEMATDLNSRIVRLNVGGMRYDVSRGTLASCQDSMLARVILPRWVDGELVPIFIDRNGRLFEYVLDYLRMGEVHLPSSVNRAAVMKEFEFYGIKADAGKVHQTSGAEYIDLFIKKADAARIEKLAIQTAAFVTQEFSKTSSYNIYNNVIVAIPQADYVQLCRHEALLRARLAERGMNLVGREWESDRAFIKVEKLNKK